MSRMGQPAADDVILDLLVDGVEPTHENLMVAITAYPQHRDALVAFFANLAVQTALNDEATPSGRGVRPPNASRRRSHRAGPTGRARCRSGAFSTAAGAPAGGRRAATKRR